MRIPFRPLVLLLAFAVVGPAIPARAQDPAPSPSPEATPPPSAPPATSKVFNPDIAVIGNFIGAIGENEFEERPSLEMSEAEVAFQAIVDPYARADFFLAFGPEGAEIEEAFITFPTLPGGFLMKVGRLKASFGKVNTFHAHQLSWIDRPLMSTTLLGEEGLTDDGISVSRLLPNPLLFLEVTGEVFRGQSDVFEAEARRDLAFGARLRGYRDLGEASNLDVGVSLARGNVTQTLTRRLIGVDATFRYRPLQRTIYRGFLARAEAAWRKTEVSHGFEDEPSSRGVYLSAEYQFARRWLAGARGDWVEENRHFDDAQKGISALVTFRPSEFSTVRAQYRRIRYYEFSPASNELLFQFLFSIGAHGAHTF